ncbi:hypothetical protein HDU98_010367 [Podochytrium sp. JEL0797]|nr:hypothetical protein HDU98_010367 [Podochytrium sp. JEL0797]
MEWINLSNQTPIFNKEEDYQLGTWLWDSRIQINWISHEDKFHNLVDAPYIQRKTTDDTVVLHYCKTNYQFDRCVSELFNGTDPSIPAEHTLTTADSIQSRLFSTFGILVSTNESSQISHLLSNYISSQPSETTPKSTLDTIIVSNAIAIKFTPLFSSPISTSMRVNMVAKVQEAAMNKWLRPSETLEIVASAHVESRLLEMGREQEARDSFYVGKRGKWIAEWVGASGSGRTVNDSETDFVLVRDLVQKRLAAHGKEGRLSKEMQKEIIVELVKLATNEQLKDKTIDNAMIRMQNKE